VFWVISVYFNIRNTLPKSGIFLLGHPVYYLLFILAIRLGAGQSKYQILVKERDFLFVTHIQTG